MGGESKKRYRIVLLLLEKSIKKNIIPNYHTSTLTQVNMGKEVKKKSDLKPGDLVFFKTGKRQKHVGVYVGNKFLHASCKGIQFTSLDKPFYKKKLTGTSRRVIN